MELQWDRQPDGNVESNSMPTPATCHYPKTKDAGEFEELALDLLARRARARLQRNGRSGQRQHGVDLVGPFEVEPTKLLGVQCKNVASLTIELINREVTLAEGFQPQLARFCVVTSLDRDAELQREVRLLAQKRATKGLFEVEIAFWQDIESELGGHHDLIAKHYPAFVITDAADSRDRELKRRALSFVRGANIAGKSMKTASAIVMVECRLEDELDVEAAYSLIGDKRVIDASVDEAGGVVSITVSRMSFPTAWLFGDDDDDGWPY